MKFKVKTAFREAKNIDDDEEIVNQIRIALAQVDTLDAKLDALKYFFEDDRVTEGHREAVRQAQQTQAEDDYRRREKDWAF